MTATNLDRIAALEARAADLEGQLAKATQHIADLETTTFRTLHGMYQAQKPGGPPRRDPASTTSHRGELGPGRAFASRRERREIEPPFGFGLPGAYVGGASVDEDVRDERWRDAQT